MSLVKNQRGSTFMRLGLSLAMAATTLLPVSAPAYATPAFPADPEDAVFDATFTNFEDSAGVLDSIASRVLSDGITPSSILINGVTEDVARDRGITDSFGIVDGLRGVVGFDSALIMAANSSIDLQTEGIAANRAHTSSDLAGTPSSMLQLQMEGLYEFLQGDLDGYESNSFTDIEFEITPTAEYLVLDYSFVTSEHIEEIDQFRDQAGIYAMVADESDWTNAYGCLGNPVAQMGITMENSGVQDTGMPAKEAFQAAQGALLALNSPILRGVPDTYQMTYVDPGEGFPVRSTQPPADFVPPPGIAYELRGPEGRWIWQVRNTCVIDVSAAFNSGKNVKLGLAVANSDDEDVPSALLIGANSLGFSDSPVPIPFGSEFNDPTQPQMALGVDASNVAIDGFTMVAAGDVLDFGSNGVAVVESVHFDFPSASEDPTSYGLPEDFRGTLIELTEPVAPEGMSLVDITYFPAGIQHNVHLARLVGWTPCIDYFPYDDPWDVDDLATYVSDNCYDGSQMMLAVDKDLDVSHTLAAGSVDALLTATTANEVNYSNGAFWYFQEGAAIGFAGNQAVDLDPCDEWDGAGSDDRMCWKLTESNGEQHISGLEGRLGALPADGGADPVSDGYDRVLFTSPVVSPAAIAPFPEISYDLDDPWCAPRSTTNDAGEVFLGGDYIELAVSRAGTFGTDELTPDTFRGVDSLSGIGLAYDIDGYCQGSDLPVDFVGQDDLDRWSLGFIDEGVNRWISPAVGVPEQYWASDDRLTLETLPVVDLSWGDLLMAKSTVFVLDEGERILRVDIVHSFSRDDNAVRSQYVVENVSEQEIFDLRLMKASESEALNSLLGQRDFVRWQTRTIEAQVSSQDDASAVSLSYPSNYPLLDAFLFYGIDTVMPLTLFSADSDSYVFAAEDYSADNPFSIEGNDAIGSPVGAPDSASCFYCEVQLLFDIGSLEDGEDDHPRTIVTSLKDEPFAIQDSGLESLALTAPKLFGTSWPDPEDLYETILETLGADLLEATNLRINGMDSTEFLAAWDQMDIEAAAGASIATYSSADKLIGESRGLLMVPGYVADAASSIDQGANWPLDKDGPNYVGNDVVYDFDGSYPDSPLGAFAQSLDRDANVPDENGVKQIHAPLEVAFDLPRGGDFLKLDFAFASTESARFDADLSQWSGEAMIYADAVGIFVKPSSGGSWLDATNCAAIPTTNSSLNMPSAGILPPSDDLAALRESAQSNYAELVAKTATSDFSLSPEAFVSRELEQPEGDLIPPPNIAYSIESLGGLMKFATTTITCSVDVRNLVAEGEDLSISILASNLLDGLIPSMVFLAGDSIRFSTNSIAAPEAIEDLVLEAAAPLLEIAPVTASPYQGPVVLTTGIFSNPGAVVELSGRNLGGVSGIEIADEVVVPLNVSDDSVTFVVPEGLGFDTYDLVVLSSSGRLLLADFLTLLQAVEPSAQAVIGSVKRIGDTARIFATNIIGAGKVQLFVNGREIAWVRAVDETDPKLRYANDTYYLVRRVELAEGKNVIEIYVDGERIRRVAYTLRD